MTEHLDARVSRVLESAILGVPAAEHFLTLPSGMTLTVPQGKDSWQVFVPHAQACISEGLCPWCQRGLSPARECQGLAPVIHRPCRWHACAEWIGQVFLDVPHRAPEARCEGCGGEM